MKGTRWLIGAAVVVVAGVWLEYRHLGLMSASDQLAEQIRLARSEGIAVTPDDLRRNPVPEDENAANLLLTADRTRHGLSGDPMLVLTGYNPKPPTQAQIRKALIEIKPVLELAELAARRPHLDMHWQWELGTEAIFPEGAIVRQLGRCLIRRAHQEAIDGDLGKAGRTLISALKLGKLLLDAPMSIDLYGYMSVETAALDEAANLIRLAKASEKSAQIAQEVLKTAGALPDQRFALQGDLVLTRIELRQIPYWADTHAHSGYYDDGFVGPDSYLLRIRSVADLNDANLISNFRAMSSLIPKDPDDFPQNRSAIKQLNTHFEELDGIGHLEYFFAPTFHHEERWAACAARRRVLRAGLNILDEKQRMGNFPEAWSGPGKDGIDPFTDKPLSYRRTANGFVVYSFDRDLKDDAGRPYSEDGRKDISFEYPILSVRPPTPPKKATSFSND